MLNKNQSLDLQENRRIRWGVSDRGSRLAGNAARICSAEANWPSNSSDFKVVERVQLQQKEYQARKSGLEKISRSGKRRMSEIYYL